MCHPRIPKSQIERRQVKRRKRARKKKERRERSTRQNRKNESKKRRAKKGKSHHSDHQSTKLKNRKKKEKHSLNTPLPILIPPPTSPNLIRIIPTNPTHTTHTKRIPILSITTTAFRPRHERRIVRHIRLVTRVSIMRLRIRGSVRAQCARRSGGGAGAWATGCTARLGCCGTGGSCDEGLVFSYRISNR